MKVHVRTKVGFENELTRIKYYSLCWRRLLYHRHARSQSIAMTRLRLTQTSVSTLSFVYRYNVYIYRDQLSIAPHPPRMALRMINLFGFSLAPRWYSIILLQNTYGPATHAQKQSKLVSVGISLNPIIYLRHPNRGVQLWPVGSSTHHHHQPLNPSLTLHIC